jgi:hypothetical protein
MTTHWLLTLPGLIPLLLAAFWAHDQIARVEHERRRGEWVKDGRPYGLFWRPAEIPFALRVRSSPRALFRWTFRTPEWAREEAGVGGYFLLLRAGALLWNLGVIALMAAMGRALGWW